MGGFFATNIGSTMPFGMDGWRFAFHLMAAVSLITSALVFYVATDPRRTAKVLVPSAATGNLYMFLQSHMRSFVGLT